MKRCVMAAIAVFAIGAPSAATAGAAVIPPPTNTSAPTISGSPYVGKNLTASTGSWTNHPTSYGYQWARCSSTGTGCAAIVGATKPHYTPAAADLNSTLEVWVTAKNAGGTAGPATSQPTAVISPALPPAQTTPPSITGSPVVGNALVANPGTYSGGAVASYAYQWQSCDPNTLACTTIAGANTDDYTPVSTEVGQRLRVVVTAANPYGHITTNSDATAAVSVAVTPVTTTLVASTNITTCCQNVHLSGTTSPVVANEPITIVGRRYGQAAPFEAATAVTNAAGQWTTIVGPTSETTYTAQTANTTSAPLVVLVHPRVGFGVSGNSFSAKITALGSFAGRVAYFQSMNPNGSWKSRALVVIDAGSVAHFHVDLARGHTYTVRIYLPRTQAGPGYLDGISHIRRVGGLTPV
jgi:hypothetical protein